MSWVEDRFIKKNKDYKAPEPDIEDFNGPGIRRLFDGFERTSDIIIESFDKMDRFMGRFSRVIKKIPNSVLNAISHHSRFIKWARIAIISLIIAVIILIVSNIYLYIRLANTVGLY